MLFLIILLNWSSQLQVSISQTFLRAAFTHAYPKSVKIQSSYQYLFALLESASIKTALRKLMKLTTDHITTCLTWHSWHLNTWQQKKGQKQNRRVELIFFRLSAHFWHQNFAWKCFAQICNFWHQNFVQKMRA